MKTIFIQTRAHEEMIRLDRQVAKVLRACKWRDGLLLLFCPHTTAALIVNETPDPDVARDIIAFLRRRIPPGDGFAHSEGNSDAHVKATLIGPDFKLMVDESRVLLGAWQGLYFYEGDGPRQREVWLKFMPTLA